MVLRSVVEYDEARQSILCIGHLVLGLLKFVLTIDVRNLHFDICNFLLKLIAYLSRSHLFHKSTTLLKVVIVTLTSQIHFALSQNPLQILVHVLNLAERLSLKFAILLQKSLN